MHSVAEHQRLARRALRGQAGATLLTYALRFAPVGALAFGGETVKAVLNARDGGVLSLAVNVAFSLAALLLFCPLSFGVKRRTFFLRHGEALPVSDVFAPFWGADLFRVLTLRVLVWGRALLVSAPAWIAAVGAAVLVRAAPLSGVALAAVGAGGAAALGVGAVLFALAWARSFLCDYLLMVRGRGVWRAMRDSDRLTRGQGDRIAALFLRGAGLRLFPPVGLPLYEATAAGVAAEMMAT